VLTVVCKATFTLKPGESPLSATQEPVCTADVMWEGDRGSLRAASDLVPFKRRVDGVVVGHAHAPQGKPVPRWWRGSRSERWTKPSKCTGIRGGRRMAH
jgi:hypothetical protein